jgi:hypothetical protein
MKVNLRLRLVEQIGVSWNNVLEILDSIYVFKKNALLSLHN